MDSYELVASPPTPDDYRRLRAESGLSPKSEAQARGALAGSWYFAQVRHRATGETVAMGRVIGDGGWYFHIADMAVLPDHQRRGLGRLVLERLLAEINDRAPETPWITLLADPPGVRLYEQMGFRPTAPGSIGMAWHPPV
jgi:GNAT superfamily N-acetyltransferase